VLKLWKLCSVLVASGMLLGACGGGSFQVTPVRDGLRASEPVIAQLSQSSPADAGRLLQELLSSKGDGLDWAGFWLLLTDSRLADRLVNDHRSTLLALQSRSCAPRAFEAFVRFAISKKLVWDTLTDEHRLCSTGMGAPLAVEILRAAIPDSWIEKRRIVQINQVVALLSKEMKLAPSRDWLFVMDRKDDAALRTIARLLVEEGSTRELFQFSAIYMRLFGEYPFLDLLAESLLFDGHGFSELVQQVGRRESTRMLEVLAASIHIPVTKESETRLAVPLRFIGEEDFAASGTHWQSAWEQYLRLRYVLSRVGSALPFQRQLWYLDELQIGLENWMRKQPPENGKWFFTEAFREFRNTRHAAEIAWFAERLYPGNLSDQVRALYLTAEGHFSNPADLAVFLRIKALLAEHTQVRKQAMDTFCDLLDAQGVSEKTITVTQWNEALSLPPGCYVISHPKELHLVRTQISASLDTVLRFPFRTVVLEAPKIALGMVDMSANLRQDFKRIGMFSLLVTARVADAKELSFIVLFDPFLTGTKSEEILSPRIAEGGRLRAITNPPLLPFGFAALGGLKSGGLESEQQSQKDPKNGEAFNKESFPEQVTLDEIGALVKDQATFSIHPNTLELFSPISRERFETFCRARGVNEEGGLSLLESEMKGYLHALLRNSLEKNISLKELFISMGRNAGRDGAVGKRMDGRLSVENLDELKEKK